MRYLFGFICVLALGVMPSVGCSETTGDGGTGGSAGSGGTAGDGGTGGSAGSGGTGGTGGIPECQGSQDCDDGNDCTGNTCASGICEYTPLANGTACDESNECTVGTCNAANRSCENTPVPDGGSCAAGRGGCYGGLCDFVPVSVAFGAREVVFDWSTERCEEFDIPDGPAKAVRASDGEIVLFGTIHETGNYLSRGNDFDSLEHDCEHPAHRSANLPTPESYENNEWLWSPYRVGTSWHVFIHNEFHDAVAANCSPSYLCWYNSITYAVSTDRARTFVKPSPPAHVVAPAPRLWVPPDSPTQNWYVEGYLGPTNIVLGPDNYYYALFDLKRTLPDMQSDIRGVCAMRTKTLDDPASWRAWDGSDFKLQMASPYAVGGDVPECEFLPSAGRQDAGTLTYNTYIDRYMRVWSWGQWIDEQTLICGFYFSLSSDLIHWSDIQLVARADIGVSWSCDLGPGAPPMLEPVQVQYPSIIDHADSTTNFERPGRTPYLYYTRHNGGYWLDRDLVRVPLTFTVEE
jgi:hypothetical protein